MRHRARSYQEEQAELLDELDRRACALAAEEFVSLGNEAGVDVVTEVLKRNKSVSQVFEMIRQKKGVEL